jgi:hypothetical protein
MTCRLCGDTNLQLGRARQLLRVLVVPFMCRFCKHIGFIRCS